MQTLLATRVPGARGFRLMKGFKQIETTDNFFKKSGGGGRGGSNDCIILSQVNVAIMTLSA